MFLLTVAWSFFLFPSPEGRWLSNQVVTWPGFENHDVMLDHGTKHFQGSRGANKESSLMDFEGSDTRRGSGEGEKSEELAEPVSMLETRGQTPTGIALKCGIMNVLRHLFTCPPKVNTIPQAIHKSIPEAATEGIKKVVTICSNGIPPPGHRCWYMGGYTPETYPRIVARVGGR